MGISIVSPGTAYPGLHPAESKDDASFVLLDDANVPHEAEQSNGSRCGQCINGDHRISNPPGVDVSTHRRAHATGNSPNTSIVAPAPACLNEICRPREPAGI